jgi:hypothetical protein
VPDGKDTNMWVFDGEEWTQDNGGIEPKAAPEAARPQYEEDLMTQLQVVEILETPRKKDVPPLPMP